MDFLFLLILNQGSLVLLNFEPDLKLLYLVLKEFLEELRELLISNLTSFVFLENLEDLFVLCLETCVDLSFLLISSEEDTNKCFNSTDFNYSRVVTINSIIDTLGELCKLSLRDKDVGQVLTGLAEIDPVTRFRSSHI